MFRVAVWILFASLAVCAQTAPNPEVVPIDKEPSHHLVFENEYVRVFSVEVAPHSETKYHQHDRDYVFVTLGDSDVESVRVGGASVKLQPKDGEAQFTKGGFAHKAVNNSDKPFRNLTIEMKERANDPKGMGSAIASGFGVTHTVMKSEEEACVVIKTTGDSATKYLEPKGKYFLAAAGRSQVSTKSPIETGGHVQTVSPGEFKWIRPEHRLFASIVEKQGGLLVCEFEVESEAQNPSHQKQGAQEDKAKGTAKK